MAKVRYHKLDLAARQLETAVWMFLESKDRFSVITLAGAASGILMQLVLNAGKLPFADYGRLIIREQSGVMPTREKYNKRVSDLFGINVLKHHAADDPPIVELSEERAAENAIIRALVDYIELRGQDAPFVKAFLQYTWVARNGPEVMKAYNAQPERVKRLRDLIK
ncbi:MAG TPA: hypothetical protein VMD49_10770 [Steroidobacteraceae bacterium]|nr:hypothetical protein [Steroidobacteraceae bacterium]